MSRCHRQGEIWPSSPLWQCYKGLCPLFMAAVIIHVSSFSPNCYRRTTKDNTTTTPLTSNDDDDDDNKKTTHYN